MRADRSPAKQTHAPAEEGSGAFVPDYLLYLLAAASHSASGEFHRQVRARGIRVPEWRVLACLSDEDGQMLTRLAAFALMEQSRMSKVVDQMAVKGLVSRRSDVADRRRVRIFLTDSGHALASELVAEASRHERTLARALPAGLMGALKDALKRINAHYEAETADGGGREIACLHPHAPTDSNGERMR